MTEFGRWCDTVTRQVRFRPDRGAIQRELTAHYQDHVRDLERVGYDWKLAEQRAWRLWATGGNWPGPEPGT